MRGGWPSSAPTLTGVALTGWRTAGYLAALLHRRGHLFTLINGLVMQINQPPAFTFWVLLAVRALLAYLAVLKGVRMAAPGGRWPP